LNQQNKLGDWNSKMEMTIDFPGGARVDAHFAQFTVRTDQPAVAGGDGSAPTPFALFLSSIGTCAGIYVLRFCKQRGLPTEGIRIAQRTHNDSTTGLIDKIELEIQVPTTFPEKYLPSLMKSAELCAVKKHLEKPPQFEIKTRLVESLN
jgi:putative redox protein